jgi:hypothetical protein
LETVRATSPGLKILDPAGALGPGKVGEFALSAALSPEPLVMGEFIVPAVVVMVFFQS